ncbi:MAG: NAD(P)/FAD-dependent oxidoreductase, partial [Actinomycetia bacterium]|nr:NAD(P)/FAD-dependent oxidoreductase [Actinomycetes bacterium]
AFALKLQDKKFAQTSVGGISLEELDENLQSLKIKGLYFGGEILDVSGESGGYNLQFAFTSGYIIGSSC